MKSDYVMKENISMSKINFLLLFLMIWLVPELWGQQVEYVYDTAGNRTQRKIITMKSSSSPEGSMTKSAVANSDGQAKVEIQKYEDMLGERKVLIYPNPTQGMIRIEFQGYGDMKGVRMLLYDTQGKLLRQVNKVEPSGTLDLSLFPAGMYILQMMEGKAKSEWKIVKE